MSSGPTDASFSPFGTDLFGEPIRQIAAPLAARFIVPPFSVLDARAGDWQERKAAWIACGIESELGRTAQAYTLDGAAWRRSHNPIPGGGTGKNSAWKFRRDGKWASNKETGLTGEDDAENGTSIFDPVLTECMFRWFCPAGGQAVDPFAGGSVRGIVASLLGFRYWGCDLRPEQVAANEAQAQRICTDPLPVWVCGDAMSELPAAPEADLLLTCPPYGDLERYSDNPLDLSTMDYPVFLGAYRQIIQAAARRLRAGCFAVIVVGDFRDKRTGLYRGFVADTIQVFRECGLGLYNDAILVTAVGSLPLRVGKQFEAGRKLGKSHQNVLVFKKSTGPWSPPPTPPPAAPPPPPPAALPSPPPPPVAPAPDDTLPVLRRGGPRPEQIGLL